MKREEYKKNNSRLRFIDLLIVILCLLIMAYSINLFRLDLFQTINLQNVQPVGTIIIRDNIVQRRVTDRVLWDRLAVESPVYLGDLIRTAEFSAAAIAMEGHQIDLGENTLIRIQPVTDGGGALQIELVEGSLGAVTTEECHGLQLNLMGRTVEVSRGTTLSATAGKDGLAVQVNSGAAAFIGEGGSREISSGTMLTFDQEGTEKIQPAVKDTILSTGRLAAAETPNAYEDNSVFSPVSFFFIEDTAAGEKRVISLFEPEPEPPPVPVELRLISPAQRARLPGLTALREQTLFRWDSGGEVQASRFVLSRNSNPLRGRPAVEIANPGRTIRLNRLEEGIWYWTVEARGVNDLVSAADPRQLQVLPVPLLSAPGSRQPPNGHRIDIEQLKIQRNITFSWSTVPGANAYVFTLYEQARNGRRQISRVTVENPVWTLEDISVLNRGTFIWQVEAINRNSRGTIEQRGSTGENTFTMDIPLPGPVQMEDPGVLYDS